MEMEYTKFVNEYAATEDRIYHLWSEILKEHLALAVSVPYLFSFSYPPGIHSFFTESDSKEVRCRNHDHEGR
jgi:hypothetical protein